MSRNTIPFLLGTAIPMPPRDQGDVFLLEFEVIPSNIKTYSMCEKAFMKVPSMIRFILPHMVAGVFENLGVVCVTREMCEEAVTFDGLYLKHIPKILRGPDLCFMPFVQNCGASEFISPGILQ